MVSLSDSSSSTSETENPRSTDFWSESIFGDGLALLSALFYALYVTLLKVKIKEESRIDMQLFFGFVGLFNVVMLWPLAVLLHFSGAETLALPSSRSAWAAVLINVSLDSVKTFEYGR